MEIYGEDKSCHIAFNKLYSMDFNLHTIYPLCLILLAQTDSCKDQVAVS